MVCLLCEVRLVGMLLVCGSGDVGSDGGCILYTNSWLKGVIAIIMVGG